MPDLSMSELWEASMECKPYLVLPFLQRVSSIITGFGAPELAEAMRAMKDIRVDETRELHLVIQQEGRAVPMLLRLLKDDRGAFELSFFTTPEIAMHIDGLMGAFAEEHGM